MNSQSTTEALMGNEFASSENEKICEMLRRHYVHERDLSLRDLKKKLEAACLSCDLRQQILYSQYKKLQERSNKIKEGVLLNNTIFHENIQISQEEKAKFDHMMAHKEDLMKQKTDKVEQNKIEKYEQDMEDKKNLEDIMTKIVEENSESMRHKSETKEMLRCEMVECQEQRRISKEQQKSFDTQEEQRFREEGLKMVDRDAIASMKHKSEMKEMLRCEMVECQEQRRILKEEQKSFDTQEEQRFREEGLKMVDRDAIASAQRADKFEKKERTNERYMCAIQEKEAEKLRRDDLVKLLQEQEREDKYMHDEILHKEQVEQTDRDIRDVWKWQMQYKADVAAEERVRDAEFEQMAHQQMFKEDEEKREKDLKKKNEQEKYVQELKQQILENAVRRKRDLENERN